MPATATNALAVASGYYHSLALLPTAVLTYRPAGNGLVIEWNLPGVLQWAPAATGPFTDMPAMSGRYTNYDFSLPSKFFRLRR